MKKVKHSKLKNTGVLFELLVRQFTADTLSGKTNSTAFEIFRKYFREGTELFKEYKLYETLTAKRYNDSEKANHLIEATINARCRLNERKLREERYKLVGEIQDSYSMEDFQRTQLSNYKVYASAYKLFRNSLELNENYDPDDLVRSRYTIIEHITGVAVPDQKTEEEADTLLSEVEQDDALRAITYKLLVEKFNDKYSTVLCEGQKDLLRAYINNVSNTNSLREYVNETVPTLEKNLIKELNYVDDKVCRIKIKETISHIGELTRGKGVRDEHLFQLMNYYEMLKELRVAHGHPID